MPLPWEAIQSERGQQDSWLQDLATKLAFSTSFYGNPHVPAEMFFFCGGANHPTLVPPRAMVKFAPRICCLTSCPIGDCFFVQRNSGEILLHGEKVRERARRNWGTTMAVPCYSKSLQERGLLTSSRCKTGFSLPTPLCCRFFEQQLAPPLQGKYAKQAPGFLVYVQGRAP